MNNQRTTALISLISLKVPTQEAIRELIEFSPMDCPVSVVLSTSDVQQVLDMYLTGTVTAQELENWADALENREDVGRESGKEEIINQLLFELSSPEIIEPINPQLIYAWKRRFSE